MQAGVVDCAEFVDGSVIRPARTLNDRKFFLLDGAERYASAHGQRRSAGNRDERGLGFDSWVITVNRRRLVNGDHTYRRAAVHVEERAAPNRNRRGERS